MLYVRAKNVAWRRIGGETVLLNLGRRRMLALNEDGGAVWEKLSVGLAPPDGERGTGSSTGLSEFLADLESEGVLEREDGAPAGSPVATALARASTAPVVLWREELHRFGGTCGFIPGGGGICDGSPENS